LEAIVEVLCRSDKPSTGNNNNNNNNKTSSSSSSTATTKQMVKFNGSNLVAPLWKEQSLVSGVYTSAKVNVHASELPPACGWAELYRGYKNGCKVSKVSNITHIYILE
jgi:hypothetical protein